MKCLKLQIYGEFDTKRLYALMDRCKQLTNMVWQQWLLYHVQNESPRKIITFLNDLAKWREASKGAEAELKKTKPKCDVLCFPNDLSNLIYHRARADFPDLNCRTLVLLLNKIRGLIVNRKATRGKLPGWQAILLNHEALPSATRPVPVPFDKQNAKVWREGKEIKIGVRCERTGDRKSVWDEFSLSLGRTAGERRYSKPIHAIAAKEQCLRGAALMYDKSRRRWYALISYQPEKESAPKVDHNKVLFLFAGRSSPWRYRVSGISRAIGGRGEFISHRRRQILLDRWSRQENYRWTATSTKSHGRDRALAGYFQLTRSWNEFCKTYNQQIAHEICKRAVEEGCGYIVLFMRLPRRFLELAGKLPDRQESTKWPWYQFSKILQDKLNEVDIDLKILAEPVKRKDLEDEELKPSG